MESAKTELLKVNNKISFPTYDSRRDLGIDVLKAVSALLVVMIHCLIQFRRLTPDYWYGLVAFSRLGVGCFFVISGYYIPMMIEHGRVKAHLWKLAKIAMCAAVVYVLYNGAYYMATAHDAFRVVRWQLEPSRMVDFFMQNECKIDIHLWFLFASIYAMAIITALLKAGKTVPLYVISIVAIVAGIAVAYIDGCVVIQRSWALYALPFMACGTAMRGMRTRAIISALSPAALWSVLAFAQAASVIEAVGCESCHDYYALSLPAAAAAMALAIKTRPHSDGWLTALGVVGLKYSLYIYIFHIAVKRTVDLFFNMMGFGGASLYAIYPLMIFLLSLGVASLWTRWRRRPF